ncbi:MAG: hypothetical protein EPO07_07255 [Verrucomicrobia bacterium]|nr:MAG: hypothetical protein EPO07_07255 [Verrucomicrobiota bacterium]
MKRTLLSCALIIGCLSATAADWQTVLTNMPLPAAVTALTRTNCASVVLGAFQSNAVIKAVIFMPGATDELFFFKRVQATITNRQPSLLDALAALTNQTPLRIAFRTPFLLIHSDEDVLELEAKVVHEATLAKLEAERWLSPCSFEDRDWDFLLKAWGRKSGVELLPKYHSPDSWHFYRHTFAGYNLSGWETIQVTALAGKTKFTIRKNAVEFEPDSRIGTLPKLDSFPR